MPDSNSRLVYSTDGENVVSRKPRSEGAGKPRGGSSARPSVPDDGVVRIQRQTSGRRGKTVTMITGIPGSDADLDVMLKSLKQHCGAGGTRDGRVLEIQGDHRAQVQAKLEALGHRVKVAGG